MEISAQTATSLAPAAPGAAPAPGGAVLSSDFQTFLTMLTVQMRNQDPLNPVDSTEFATQLATFSSVEQQVRTNELLTALGAQMGALGVSQLAAWVGMTARAVMPAVLDGSPVTITSEGSAIADSAELVVRDAAGNEVQRLPVDPGRQEMEWAGVGTDGAPLPPGSYWLSVESFAQGERIATDPVYVHARIIEARNENGVPLLVMDSGQVVDAASVVGLREDG